MARKPIFPLQKQGEQSQQRKQQREMGCDSRTFLSTLPHMLRGDESWQQMAPERLHIQSGHGTVEIVLQPLPMRRIASLSLPRLAVSLCFEQTLDQAYIENFLCRFELHFHRGGG